MGRSISAPAKTAFSDYARAHKLDLHSAPLRLEPNWLCLVAAGLAVFEPDANGNLSHRILKKQELPKLAEGRVFSHLSFEDKQHRLSKSDLKLVRRQLRLAPVQSRPVAAGRLLDLSPMDKATLARVLEANERPIASGRGTRKASQTLVFTTQRLIALDTDAPALHRTLHPTADEQLLPHRLRLRRSIGDLRELELAQTLLTARDGERVYRTATAMVVSSNGIAGDAPAAKERREAVTELLELAAELGHPFADGMGAWLSKQYNQDRHPTLPPNLWQVLHEWNLPYDHVTWLLFGSNFALTDHQRADLVRAALPRLQDMPRTQRVTQQVRLAQYLADHSLLEASNMLDRWLETLVAPTPEQLRDFLDGKRAHAAEQAALRLGAELCSADKRPAFIRRGMAFAPFDEAWLRGLEGSVTGAVNQRAAEVRSVLFGRTQMSTSDDQVCYPRRSLTDDSLSTLQQSLGSGGSTMNFLASKVGTVVEPDTQTLRQYCERLTDKDAPATKALGAAASLLATPEVELYVSRGNNDIGVHAYPAKRPFILLGSQHMDPNSIYHISEAALGFSFARELYYLRTNTPRLTQRDLSRGLLNRGRQGIDIALSVLPVLGTLRLSKRIGVIGAKLGAPKAMETIRTAKNLSQQMGLGDKPQSAELGVRSEAVVDFRYRTAFVADRVGLICCQSFRASVLAILRSRTDTARAAIHLEKRPLLELLDSLSRTSMDAHSHVLMRVAMLLSFFLSEEFEQIAKTVFSEAAPLSS